MYLFHWKARAFIWYARNCKWQFRFAIWTSLFILFSMLVKCRCWTNYALTNCLYANNFMFLPNVFSGYLLTHFQPRICTNIFPKLRLHICRYLVQFGFVSLLFRLSSLIIITVDCHCHQFLPIYFCIRSNCSPVFYFKLISIQKLYTGKQFFSNCYILSTSLTLSFVYIFFQLFLFISLEI